MTFRPEDNQLKWYFTQPYFQFQPAMRHRMQGFDDGWSDFQMFNSREYTNLPPGTYVFEVQSELSPAIASFPFRILPRWYQTSWFRLFTAVLAVAGVLLLVDWHHRRLDTQKRKLEKEKVMELAQQRVAARNELLQAEILNHNRKLADVTISLIRKNEMLQGLRERLAQARPEERQVPMLRQLALLIDEHLGSEEDWALFESNFNQLHHAFFTRLKTDFPEMTPGDLRLAAYLKMNLSSKEIAPLLNISLRGVENKRYRLRTKLGLDASVNLTEYLMGY
jgi:DNA-binding CsgD family transcriptional regulator